MSLTNQEADIVLSLGEIWNRFLELPVEHNDDEIQFRMAIHMCQEKVLMRSGRREINSIA